MITEQIHDDLQFKKSLDNPDLFRDEFVTSIMSEVPVIGISGAASK